MILTIHLPIRAMSSTNGSSRDIGYNKQTGRSFIMKSKKAKLANQEYEIFLHQYKPYLQDFKKIFNPKIHAFSVQYFWYYSNLFTKKGDVNSSCPDNDNPIKQVKDSIFNTIGINDKYVKKEYAESVFSDNDAIVVIIELYILERKKITLAQE